MGIDKNNCTNTVEGIVENVRVKGQDFPTMITVSYFVDGRAYEVTESIKLKSEIIKLGFLPIGQKKVPKMGRTEKGSKVKVNYNPLNPEEAYITDNVGIMNA